MARYSILFGLLLFAYVACSEVPDQSVDNRQEYRVYKAVLDSLHRFDLAVVQEETMLDSSSIPLDELTSASFFDYYFKNQSPHKLSQKDFGEIAGIQLVITALELEQIEEESNTFWDEFHARYPTSGGLITLSRVGFSINCDSAKVSFHRISNPYVSYHWWVELVGEYGEWNITKTIQMEGDAK